MIRKVEHDEIAREKGERKKLDYSLRKLCNKIKKNKRVINFILVLFLGRKLYRANRKYSVGLFAMREGI